MKIRTALVCAVLAVVLSVTLPAMFAGCLPQGQPVTINHADPVVSVPTPSPQSPVEAQPLLAETNAYRSQHGLPAFAWDNRLAVSASTQAIDCAHRSQLSHVGSDGSTPWDRIARAGLNYSTASENAYEAGWTPTPAEVVLAWAADPPHQANLVGPFARMGAASAVDAEGKVYWFADYASEQPAANHGP